MVLWEPSLRNIKQILKSGKLNYFLLNFVDHLFFVLLVTPLNILDMVLVTTLQVFHRFRLRLLVKMKSSCHNHKKLLVEQFYTLVWIVTVTSILEILSILLNLESKKHLMFQFRPSQVKIQIH